MMSAKLLWLLIPSPCPHMALIYSIESTQPLIYFFGPNLLFHGLCQRQRSEKYHIFLACTFFQPPLILCEEQCPLRGKFVCWASKNSADRMLRTSFRAKIIDTSTKIKFYTFVTSKVHFSTLKVHMRCIKRGLVNVTRSVECWTNAFLLRAYSGLTSTARETLNARQSNVNFTMLHTT